MWSGTLLEVDQWRMGIGLLFQFSSQIRGREIIQKTAKINIIFFFLCCVCGEKLNPPHLHQIKRCSFWNGACKLSKLERKANGVLFTHFQLSWNTVIKALLQEAGGGSFPILPGMIRICISQLISSSPLWAHTSDLTRCVSHLLVFSLVFVFLVGVFLSVFLILVPIFIFNKKKNPCNSESTQPTGLELCTHLLWLKQSMRNTPSVSTKLSFLGTSFQTRHWHFCYGQKCLCAR